MHRRARIAALVNAVIAPLAGGGRSDSAAESNGNDSMAVAGAADMRRIDPLRCDLPTEPPAQQGQWSTASQKLRPEYGSGLIEQIGYYTEWMSGSYLMLLTPTGGAQTMWTWAG